MSTMDVGRSIAVVVDLVSGCDDEDDIDCVDFYSKISHNCDSVSLRLLWRCASTLEAGSSLKASIFGKDYISEIFDTLFSRLGMEHMVVVVDSCRVFEGSGMAVVTHRHVQQGKVTCGILGVQLDLDEGRLQRVIKGLGVDEFDGVFEIVDAVQTLCDLSLCSLADNMTKLRGLGNKYREFAGLLTKKAVPDEVSMGALFVCQGIDGKYVEMNVKASTLEQTGDYIDLDRNEGQEEKVLVGNGILDREHVDRNLNLFGNVVPNDLCGLSLGGVEGSNRWDHDLNFDMYFVPSLLSLSLKALAESAEELVTLRQVLVNICVRLTNRWCDEGLMNVGFLNFMVEGSAAVICKEHCSWLTEEQFQQKLAALVSWFEVFKETNSKQSIVWTSSSSMCGLITKVPFSEMNRIDQHASLYAAIKKAVEEIKHTCSQTYGFSLTRLRFFPVCGLWERPDMAYCFFTNDILKWKFISLFKPANERNVARDFAYNDEIVKGCVAAMDTTEKISGSAGTKKHQLSDAGWLVSVWFPRPRVKMKLGKMRHNKLDSMIPCGQGILRGRDCCNHILRGNATSAVRHISGAEMREKAS